MKLYEIAIQFQKLKEMELDEEVLQDTLEALEGTLEEKADNITKVMRELELAAEAKKAEAKRLVELAENDLKKRQKLFDYLDFNLKQAGIKKLNTSLFKLSYRKGSEVVEVDPERLPKEFFIPQDPKPMGKTELKKIIKEQEIEIEGVTIKRNPDSLQIK